MVGVITALFAFAAGLAVGLCVQQSEGVAGALVSDNEDGVVRPEAVAGLGLGD